MLNLFYFILILLYVLYVLRELGAFLHYNKGKEDLKGLNTDVFPMVSVVVPFRNEEKYLPKLLIALAAQEYPADKLEFLLVNDHSTDLSASVIERFRTLFKKSKVELLQLDKNAEGKKAALAIGVGAAKGEYLLFTDADCVVKPKWVYTMVKEMLRDKVLLLAGPVSLDVKQNTAIGVFQNLEHLALQVFTVAGFKEHDPILCNGANLMVKRSVFIEYEASRQGKQSVSGDDVFLLHFVKKKYYDECDFCKKEDALVLTAAEEKFSGFFAQRLRWASKSRHYSDKSILFQGVLITITAISFVSAILGLIFMEKITILALAYIVIKVCLDVYLLVNASKWYKLEVGVKKMILFVILYPFYAVFMAFLSLIIKTNWKGRAIN